MQRDLKTGKMLILESNKGSSHYSFTMKEEKPSKEEEPTQYPDDPEVQAFFDEFDKASRKRREKEKQRKAKEQSKTKTQTHKEFNPNVWRNPTTGKLMYLEGNNS